ncbi:MAG: hypothetical protein M1390_01095 [Candidatus Marsarchaeota archaeon]|nr:hypothetical protein [Candidatus Marsarchaeota archaeon]
MADRISSTAVKREPGYLYYLGKDGYVWRTPMRGKKGSKEKVSQEKVSREEGYLYFIDSSGYVSRAKQARGRK